MCPVARSAVLCVVPVHPPKYSYAYKLLASRPPDVDLLLVFTDQRDRDGFDAAALEGVQSLLLTTLAPPDVIALATARNIMPSLKKSLALWHMRDCYEYFLSIDAETQFLPGKVGSSIYASVDQFYRQQRLYAGQIDPAAEPVVCEIIRSSALLLGNARLLQEITRNFTLYFWYSDIPVYARDDLQAFGKTEHLGFSNPRLMASGLTWHSFDYIVYAYFLVLCRGWEIVAMPGATFSLEQAPSWQVYQCLIGANVRQSFTWVNPTVARTAAAWGGLHDSVCMTYHHDRHG